MKKTIIIISLMLFVLVGVVCATPSYYFKQNTEVDLKFTCFNATNGFCDNETLCQAIILYPNNSILISNASMTWNYNYFNQTLTSSQTNVLGEYFVTITCQGDNNNYSIFSYEITPLGYEVKGLSGIALMLGIALFTLLIIYLSNSIDQQHWLLKLLLIFFVPIGFVMMGTLGVNLAYGFTNMSSTFFKITLSFIILFSLYVMIYFIWHVFNSMKIRKRDG